MQVSRAWEDVVDRLDKKLNLKRLCFPGSTNRVLIEYYSTNTLMRVSCKFIVSGMSKVNHRNEVLPNVSVYDV